MVRTLSVWVGAQIIYLYGTVNGETATFTLIGNGEWQSTVPRSEDDNYELHLEAYSANGLEGTYDYTLYYGMMLCVTDRTWDDVRNKTAKGFYNATDLNRVGHNVSYLTELLGGYGYVVLASPKTDWQIGDIPSAAQMAAYLADLTAVRGAIAVLSTTPEAPERMGVSEPGAKDGLDAQKANDIERILQDVDWLITNMVAAYVYSGEVYSGEV